MSLQTSSLLAVAIPAEVQMEATIDLETCVGCGICVTRCPEGAVSWASEVDMIPQVDADLCAGCGVCVELCPTAAIELPGFTATVPRTSPVGVNPSRAADELAARLAAAPNRRHDGMPRRRISPAWWPLLATASPVVIPWLAARSFRFLSGEREATQLNARRVMRAGPLELPALRSLEITVVVEQEHEEGFLGDAAVSYLIRSDRGSVLMDIGFGTEHPAFPQNANRLDLTMEDVDALLISHLHLDHMGGLAAQRAKRICLPDGFSAGPRKPCLVPADCEADNLTVQRVDRPTVLEQGLATTGPLARMLYFFGLMEEQAVVARLEGKGLVVLTGCGHPTVEVIMRMVRRLSDEPLYAFGGGLHLPITRSRSRRMGVEMQQLFGTGKPIWSRIDDDDLTSTIRALNHAAPRRLLLSAHDTCDYAIDRLIREVDADVEVFRAGATYVL